ncbi:MULTISPECIES: hypothetical protein [unclassified Microbacterium]|uniref:hypothetical protein n=1 Tax=unclassified Microbacterium TaxID=2609290 RepID=UPI0012F9ED07|nr:hypothetical protein [Microbacterium sp. MAH-37]MVQ43902.1 hypothetical protein [Microbacterium sp. MAH-37]
MSLYGKFTELGEADDEVAGILEEYADEVEDLTRRARLVRDDCESAWAAIWARRAEALGPVQESLLGWSLDWDEVRTVGLSIPSAATTEPAWIDTDAWQGAIDDFTTARAAYRRLRHERQELDAATEVRLRQVQLFATLSDDWHVSPRGVSAMVDAWAGDISSVTAEALAAVDDPHLVAQIWASLTGDQQRALIAAGPLLLGGLAGLPPWARVAANKLNAKARIRQINRVLDAQPDPYRPLTDDELAKLKAERSYLTDAVDGKFGLCYYDHKTDSIIEMIGEITPETTEINTYVPGTYTSALSFYGGGVQQVGEWLHGRDPNIVSFVWKVGSFPGENPTTGGADLTRIGEANDEDYTLGKGAQVAAFQTELHTATGPTNADFNGIGHSWGLAAITSAEVAGARFDNVVSLAGAGMPEIWRPNPGTEYAHYSYTDILSMGQDLGLVWNGRNPDADPAFDSTVYERDGDFDLPLYSGTSPYTGTPTANPAPTIPASTKAMDNHNLIATNKPENRRGLESVLKEIR